MTPDQDALSGVEKGLIVVHEGKSAANFGIRGVKIMICAEVCRSVLLLIAFGVLPVHSFGRPNESFKTCRLYERRFPRRATVSSWLDERLLLNWYPVARKKPTVYSGYILIPRLRPEREWNPKRWMMNFQLEKGTHKMKRVPLIFAILATCNLTLLAADDSGAPNSNASGAAVDNTAINSRDNSGNTQTSGDQSNHPNDVRVTAAIRRAIVNDDSLSTTAKNVKIITNNGEVTLRGPVNTADEKARIEQLAKSASANVKIDNQLEVKQSQ